jgi:hypothetical protein
MTAPRKNRRILEMTFGLLALAGTAAVLSAASAEPPSPAQPPSLQGTWTLNEDLTARMREDDQQHGTKKGFGGGSGRHGGGRRGGGGGGQGGGTPDGSTANADSSTDGSHPEGDHPAFAAQPELTITRQGPIVTITDKDGKARVLHADGSKVKDDNALGGGPAEIQTKWDKDGSLVVQVKPAKGPKRTETYIVSDDGKHLYIVLDVEGDGSRPEFKIRRAYDPAPPAEKPSAPAESSGEGDTELA